ncbi:MAG: protein translocase subunit SecD [Candidatus Pacebacteria bacterium]|nr:protein translocase subunit SecD [Candidatus Paceibacterota bacterium]
MSNSIWSKIFKPSALGRIRWIFILIIIFAAMSFLIAGGNYYNQASSWLSEKTNQSINLPKVAELPFRLGLDLQGGTHLVYQADVSSIKEGNRLEALNGVRDVVERRVNVFGVSEPVIQVNHTSGGDYRLIVELAGIKDVDEAISMIGETPLLEFKEIKAITNDGENPVLEEMATSTEMEAPEITINSEDGTSTATAVIDLDESSSDFEENWTNTKLSGKNLKRATIQFDPNDNSPQVSLEFDSEGSDLFAEITARNVGKPLAIFLDGYVISAPTVNEKITGGQAVINGRFTMEEAKLLVQRLNAGALPVPIELVSQKTVGASLGAQSINSSLKAGLLGLLLVAIFLIVYYRLPGLWAVLSLSVYGLTVLAIFKAMPIILALLMVVIIVGLMIYTFHDLKVFDSILSVLLITIGIFLFVYALKPVTLTLSGLAGFILSIGMAVDANVLIFERFKEELRSGKSLKQSIEEGFRRAWPSIRDGNISTIFICLVLMFFATGSVQGFGTTLFIGISVSMFSAIVITRTLMLLASGKKASKVLCLMGVRNKINK